MAKKKTHGGKRKGAGRPLAHGKEGVAVVLTASVPSSLVEQLDAIADREGWTRSRAITEAVRCLINSNR
jgi:hypothetical protein